MTNDFRQKFSRISMYFRPHFREKFRLMVNIENDFQYFSKNEFLFASRRLIVWRPHSWLTKLSRGWWGKKVFACANILCVPNYMNRTIAIYLNLIYNAIIYSIPEFFFLYILGPKNYFTVRSIKQWNRKTTVRLKLWIKIFQRTLNTVIV